MKLLQLFALVAAASAAGAWKTCEKLECQYRKSCGVVIPKSSIHHQIAHEDKTWDRLGRVVNIDRKACIKACEDNNECQGWSYGIYKSISRCLLLDQDHAGYVPKEMNNWASGKCFKKIVTGHKQYDPSQEHRCFLKDAYDDHGTFVDDAGLSNVNEGYGGCVCECRNKLNYKIFKNTPYYKK